jgi:predicted amidophosphoribosyltransferase
MTRQARMAAAAKRVLDTKGGCAECTAKLNNNETPDPDCKACANRRDDHAKACAEYESMREES